MPINASNGFVFKNLNRFGTNSVKWERARNVFGTPDLLPMWVADGDIPCPPEIGAALQGRARHEIYGYTLYSETFFPVLKKWFENRFTWDVKEEWYVHSPGVISALNVALLVFCQPGDRVLVQPPVYHRFFEIIRDGAYEQVLNPLKLIGGRYEIDFAHLEQEFERGVKMFVLCSPQNPIGRVWMTNELERILCLAEQYNVLIFSDEIFSDIILPGYVHTPLLKLCSTDARVILCNAPSKTFNIAGLQMSNVWIPNCEIRDRFIAMRNRCGNPSPNLFGLVATEAAYKYGAAWLDGFLELVVENLYIVRNSLARNNNVQLTDSQATYFAWLDFREFGLSGQDLSNLVTTKAKLGLSPGNEFGRGGDGFMRMNLSCDCDTTRDAMDRLLKNI